MTPFFPFTHIHTVKDERGERNKNLLDAATFFLTPKKKRKRKKKSGELQNNAKIADYLTHPSKPSL